MGIDESYFFTGELEDLILARVGPQFGPQSGAYLESSGALEGEIPPEDALQTLRTWLGF